MNLEILFEDNSVLANQEALDRGYRNDIVVCIDGKKYKIRVISLIRLKQEFEAEFEIYGYYQSEPNMILVQDTTKEEIISTIVKMYDCKYFEALDNYGFYPEFDS